MIITLSDYFMGRDEAFKGEFTPEIHANAIDLLGRVNRLLQSFPKELRDEVKVSSGWRPPSINVTIPGAALRSKHMTGQAIDLLDPEGDLDEWCIRHSWILAQPDIDLYMEHPAVTKNWCHLQSVPPKSQLPYPLEIRRRWFYP